MNKFSLTQMMVMRNW